MSTKKKDLQPWLDYFEMLHTYEEKGLLQMEPEKHEAYITLPALHAMSEGDDPQQQMTDGSIEKTVCRLRAYAGWKFLHGVDFLKQDFAVHVVAEEEPHDLLLTLLLSHVRPWWWPWWKREYIEVIDYRAKKNG